MLDFSARWDEGLRQPGSRPRPNCPIYLTHTCTPKCAHSHSCPRNTFALTHSHAHSHTHTHSHVHTGIRTLIARLQQTIRVVGQHSGSSLRGPEPAVHLLSKHITFSLVFLTLDPAPMPAAPLESPAITSADPEQPSTQEAS